MAAGGPSARLDIRSTSLPPYSLPRGDRPSNARDKTTLWRGFVLALQKNELRGLDNKRFAAHFLQANRHKQKSYPDMRNAIFLRAVGAGLASSYCTM